MITRRCTQRTFLMRPDQDTNRAFLYCLAIAANRTEVEVIFFLAMSNHYHAGIFDRAGRLPEFLETFHRLFAKHQNALRGRWENFWAAEQTSAVELGEADDILAKMVYTLTNPVAADLVERAHQWPGAHSLAANLDGRTLHAARPSTFFRKKGRMAEDAILRIHRPPGFEDLSQQEFAALLSRQIRDTEVAADKDRTRRGVKVLGVPGILAQDWRAMPSTPEPRRVLDPRIATKNPWRRLETIRRNKAFVAEYRRARDQWRSGMPATFPEGTYWLRRFAGVPCAAPAPS
jgi:putative transposase